MRIIASPVRTLRSQNVWCLTDDGKGNLYFGTPHGVIRWNPSVAESDGHSYKSAAAALGSSVNTVAFHMKSIYAKLHVHSKSEAVAKALRHRIVR